MTLKKYHIYLARLFVSKFIKISIVFFCTVILINFFEEIRFSEKYNIEIYYVFYLSFLNAPSLIFESMLANSLSLDFERTAFLETTIFPLDLSSFTHKNF